MLPKSVFLGNETSQDTSNLPEEPADEDEILKFSSSHDAEITERQGA